MPLSETAARAALAQQDTEVWLACVRIYGTGLESMRIVTDSIDCLRADGVYRPYPFDADFPDDAERSKGSATLRVCNVDRAVTRLLKEYDGEPFAELFVVLASQPNVIERGPYNLRILSASVDESIITMALGPDSRSSSQSVPAQTYTPSNSPALAA